MQPILLIMKGAIFFASKYGSTKQYSNWIAQATGLPVFNINNAKTDLSNYDFLVLGSPIIYNKLLFTVSGAPAGKKLDGWNANSNLPKGFISKVKHIALRGRQNPKELTLYDRLMLIIGAIKNPDPVARKEELHGFDYMDKSSIEPIIKLVKQFQEKK